MFDIFEEVKKISDSGQSSRLNAQEYTDKLLESIELLKGFHLVASKSVDVKKLVSTDTVLQTAGTSFGGKVVTFKMAFNCASSTPYAVEIIEVEK